MIILLKQDNCIIAMYDIASYGEIFLEVSDKWHLLKHAVDQWAHYQKYVASYTSSS